MSNNKIEGVKAVFFFFKKRFQIHKKYKKHKTYINNFHSDDFYRQSFYTSMKNLKNFL